MNQHVRIVTYTTALLLLAVLLGGCLERRIFVKWDSSKKPEFYLHWKGDSVDLASGTLPGYLQNWILQPPKPGKEDEQGSFEQTGVWDGQTFFNDNLLPPDARSYTEVASVHLSEESPITPFIKLRSIYLGPVKLRILEGSVPGNANLPFADPDSGAPVSKVEAIKEAGIPLTAASQDSIESEHAQAVMQFRKMVAAKMLDHLSDSLELQHPKNPATGVSEWAERLAGKWYNTLRADPPQSNDLDYWTYISDTLLPAELLPTQMPKAYSTWKALKRVSDTYNDLKDESITVDFQYGGWLIGTNADTTYGDTLQWKFDGAMLQYSGPYSMEARFLVWSWTGALTTLAVLGIIFTVIVRLRRKRG